MLGKENAKRKAVLQVSTSRKRQGIVAAVIHLFLEKKKRLMPVLIYFLPEISEESSEDEPLINLKKKRKVQPTVKTPQRKTSGPKKQDEKHVAGKDRKGVWKSFLNALKAKEINDSSIESDCLSGNF